MNPEQLLNQITEAIKTRPASPAKRYWLCFKDNKFTCVPIAAPTGETTVLAVLSEKEFSEGLTTKQWGKLLTKVAKIKKE